MEEIPVVIVGGGPIGLTLSCILGKNDIKHVLLEKNESTSKWPKAILTNTRSMELYRRLGMDAALREKELPSDSELTIGESLVRGPLLRFSLAHMTGKNARKSSDGTLTFDEQWTTENILRLSQIYIEPILKEIASKHRSSDIKFGWRVEAISQTEDKVIVKAFNEASGERKVYDAQYAVGCDGGKSFVRKSLGVHFKGKFDLAPMKSISFESPKLQEKIKTNNILGAATVNKNLQGLTLPLDNEGLFVTHMSPIDKDASPEELMGHLLDHEDIPYKIVFSNDWQGNFAAAETLQVGRIFLTGDACHVMVPIGGFGMNTGISDAFDLGWKLVATLKGWGGKQLLASYTAERLPYINKVLDRIQLLFSTFQNYGAMSAFLISTPPFSYIMKMLLSLWSFNPRLSGILFGIRLDASPICIPSNTPLPPDNLLDYSPTAYPGCRAPHYQFDDGTTLYDKLGSQFTLLHLQPSNQNPHSLVAAAAQSGIPLKVLQIQNEKLKKLYRDMDFVLIRPDLYIAWCGNEVPTLNDGDVNKRAMRLMKVVTGAAKLPGQWEGNRKNRSTLRAKLWLPMVISLLVVLAAVLITFMGRINSER